MTKNQWHDWYFQHVETSRWNVRDFGTEKETAECSACGFKLKAEVYGKAHSLPSKCIRCHANMMGFDVVRKKRQAAGKEAEAHETE